jgi:hypothetical protein
MLLARNMGEVRKTVNVTFNMGQDCRCCCVAFAEHLVLCFLRALFVHTLQYFIVTLTHYIVVTIFVLLLSQNSKYYFISSFERHR